MARYAAHPSLTISKAASSSGHQMTTIVGWLYDWQTLITGLAAFGAAVLTVRVMSRQARDESDRKKRAARAMMPATLAGVQDYCVASIRWLKQARPIADQIMAQSVRSALNPLPALHEATVNSLRDCVEHLDVGPSTFVSELLSKMQVQQSRMSGLFDYMKNNNLDDPVRTSLKREVDQYIADSVGISAYALALLPYARRETEGTPKKPGVEAIEHAFKQCELSVVGDVGAWNIVTTPYLPRNVS